MAKPKLLILGGGYAGTSIAKLLDAHFEITLIERSETYFHNIGSLRAVTKPEWFHRISIPFDGLLKHGKVLRGNVSAVHDGTVTLEDGLQLTYDYLVLATGASYPFPAHAPHRTSAENASTYQALAGRVTQAKRIAIIGGGPVGIELTGEIIHAHPEKNLTLIHSRERLIGPPFSPKLGERLKTRLESYGVKVLLKQSVTHVPDLEATGPHTLETSTGERIMADLVFRCFGGAPNTAYLHTMPDVLTPAGRVKVDSTLQVIGHPYMYALGDLTDINEPKLGLNIGPQAAVLAQNLKDAAAGKPPRKQYTPSKGSVMMVTLGEKDGVAQLPFGVVGGFLPRIKARDLLSGQAWQRMNVIAPK